MVDVLVVVLVVAVVVMVDVGSLQSLHAEIHLPLASSLTTHEASRKHPPG